MGDNAGWWKSCDAPAAADIEKDGWGKKAKGRDKPKADAPARAGYSGGKCGAKQTEGWGKKSQNQKEEEGWGAGGGDSDSDDDSSSSGSSGSSSSSGAPSGGDGAAGGKGVGWSQGAPVVSDKYKKQPGEGGAGAAGVGWSQGAPVVSGKFKKEKSEQPQQPSPTAGEAPRRPVPAAQQSITVSIVGAKGLSGGSSCSPFCEAKLRKVVHGKVKSDHADPQKQTTKVKKGTADPQWGEQFSYTVRSGDACRISVFSKGTMGKKYLGKADLMMTEILPTLQPGGASQKAYPLSAAEGKDAKDVSGEIIVAVGLAPTA